MSHSVKGHSNLKFFLLSAGLVGSFLPLMHGSFPARSCRPSVWLFILDKFFVVYQIIVRKSKSISPLCCCSEEMSDPPSSVFFFFFLVKDTYLLLI